MIIDELLAAAVAAAVTPVVVDSSAFVPSITTFIRKELSISIHTLEIEVGGDLDGVWKGG